MGDKFMKNDKKGEGQETMESEGTEKTNKNDNKHPGKTDPGTFADFQSSASASASAPATAMGLGEGNKVTKNVEKGEGTKMMESEGTKKTNNNDNKRPGKTDPGTRVTWTKNTDHSSASASTSTTATEGVQERTTMRQLKVVQEGEGEKGQDRPTMR